MSSGTSVEVISAASMRHRELNFCEARTEAVPGAMARKGVGGFERLVCWTCRLTGRKRRRGQGGFSPGSWKCVCTQAEVKSQEKVWG